MDITEIPETRPIADSLATLEKHIRQKEDGGGNLVVVAAGKQGNVDFNFVSFFVPQDVNVQPPKVSLVKVTDPVETDAETAAVEGKLEQQGKTALFLAPIFDSGELVMVAVCRDGAPAAILKNGTPLRDLPVPNAPAGVAEKEKKEFTTKPSKGAFRGNSSEASGLRGVETIFVDGTDIINATERLAAVRGGNLGPKDAQQVRTSKNKVHVINQAGYCWQQRTLSDVVLVEDFAGFPAGTPFRTGKSTRFGKFDDIDEGTGSELLKVVQTNSDVFGCSLKQSLLAASFGMPLKNKPDLLRAQVEIFNEANGRFARVPIVDVGPAERLEAVIDLTFALDKFLGTDGSAKVQFRIVV